MVEIFLILFTVYIVWFFISYYLFKYMMKSMIKSMIKSSFEKFSQTDDIIEWSVFDRNTCAFMSCFFSLFVMASGITYGVLFPFFFLMIFLIFKEYFLNPYDMDKASKF